MAQVVALANLLPLEQSTDDLDSWMYQTVGHQVVGSLGICTGLPLYRRGIRGGAMDQGLVYQAATREDDEVEDLYCLLAYCKQDIPGLQAVCSGAIASDYQRTRVEHVCARLGLVSLAPLWHRPQSRLLQGMISGGIEAVLVKVAAAGLTVDGDLGAPLASLVTKLHALRRKYGCNVCGEGGEYETLTLDCPAFTRGRIVLDAWEPRVSSGDSMAPVAVLHPTAFHVEPKGSGVGVSGSGQDGVIDVPLHWRPPRDSPPDPVAAAAAAAAAGPLAAAVQLSVRCSGDYLTLAAWVVPPSAAGPHLEAAALSACLSALGAALCDEGLSWTSPLYVHLFVPAMSAFAAANAVYGAFFPSVSPPARATVQPRGGAMAVEVLAVRSPRPAPATLHVQSISAWAPSCIGPYAQAVSHAGLVRFAGQIGLDPASMAVVGGGLEAQARRCLESCAAVGVARGTDLHRAMLCAVVFLADEAGEGAAVRVVHDAVARYLDSGESGWVEEGAESGTAGPGETAGDESGEGEQLDEYLLPPVMPLRRWQPLLTYITLPQLPRGVLVEIQPTALDASVFGPQTYAAPSSSSSSDDDDDDASWVAQLERRSVRNGDWSSGREGVTSSGRAAHWQAWCDLEHSVDPACHADLVDLACQGLAEGSLTPSDVVWARVYTTQPPAPGAPPPLLAGVTMPVIHVTSLAVLVSSSGEGGLMQHAGAVLELWAASSQKP